MQKFYIQKNKGFTLVEVLVAIAIFTFAVLSMMVILGGSLSNINYAKKKTTATYLAQEGIEYMRNLRDTFVLYAGDAEDGWVSFLDYTKLCSQESVKFCYFKPETFSFTNDFKPITDMDILSCGQSGSEVLCPELYFHLDDLSYDYTPALGENSGFHRAIRVQRINSDEVSIMSYVFWNQASGTQQVSFKEHLYDWTK